jgi:hypothetical protein
VSADVSNLVDMMNGAMEQTVPPVAEMLGGVIALAAFDAAKYYPLVKNVDIKFTGMARGDLRAETTLDEDEIERIEAEAAERGKADFRSRRCGL